MNPFIDVISAISPLSPAASQALQQQIEVQHLQKNAHLLKIGKVATHLYHIHQGLARVYYNHHDIDVTDYFAIDHQFIGAVESLFTGQPSKKGIQLVEDSVIYSIAYQQLEKLCREHHEIERAGRRMMTFAFLEGQQRIESIRFHEAKERYVELNEKYPGLVNRCPLKYIASYLGITQVSLSRLRAAL